MAPDGEALEWQRLKVVQHYWEGERTNQLEGFSAALRHLGEPVYWNAPTNRLSGHFYRFLWLRTFDKPIVVTLTSLGDGQVEVRSKVFSGRSGFDMGRIERHESTTCGPGAAAALMADLDDLLPLVPEYDGDFGADGAEWMIDGLSGGRYFVVHRWTPESGWVRHMGLRFLEVAGIEGEKIY
jgi:hypothetical protein